MKKKVYELSDDPKSTAGETERATLLSRHSTAAPNDVFIPLLNAELEKITRFYTQIEREVTEDVEELRVRVEQAEERGMAPTPYQDEDDDEDDDVTDEDEGDGTHLRSGTRDSSKRRRKASLGMVNGMVYVDVLIWIRLRRRPPHCQSVRVFIRTSVQYWEL